MHHQPVYRDSFLRRLETRLYEPVPIGFLIRLRILLGALLLYEVWVFFHKNLIERFYVLPEFHFHYLGFEWVHPWPRLGMYLHFAALGVLAVFILLGFAYRLAMPLFCLGFSYVFLLEQARFQNHFYLIILVCGIMSVMPAHSQWSVDVRLRPMIRRSTVPAWMLWLLQFQIGVVYFYGGLAKLDPDWLSGIVMPAMLSYRRLPVAMELAESRTAVLLLSYLALIFDLFVVPSMLWKKTRIAALVAMVIFHACNSVLFLIGIFPFLMIGVTLILFVPERRSGVLSTTTPDVSATHVDKAGQRSRRITMALLSFYVAAQILIPLRHWLYPGSATWTDQGQNFAWRMMMRDKFGYPPRFPVSYVLHGQRFRTEIPVPRDPDYWRADWQFRKMLWDPDMVLQFVHFSAKGLRDQGARQVDIRAFVPVSLNGRPPRLLIDTNTNLANVQRSLWPKPWITSSDLPVEESKVWTAAGGESLDRGQDE